MALVCEYCRGACDEGAVKCKNCGAPIDGAAAEADSRFCPYCRRRLVALGSPACNYCGRRLPDNYIRAHEAGLHRINQVETRPEASHADRKIVEMIGETAKRGGSEKNSVGDLLKALIGLTDL